MIDKVKKLRLIHDFVETLPYNKAEDFVRGENLAWPVIFAYIRGLISADAITDEGWFYVECTFQAALELGMEA